MIPSNADSFTFDFVSTKQDLPNFLGVVIKDVKHHSKWLQVKF